jgi:hypothetical protein
MAKHYVGGYDKFRIILRKSGREDEIINFSFKYEALKEYHEVISSLHKYTDGSKEEIVHYVEYEWRIFYTDEIEAEDLLKFQKIENATKNGFEIWLIPHIDTEYRIFNVLVLREKVELSLHSHFGGQDETTNYGFMISFINKSPINDVNYGDPNELFSWTQPHNQAIKFVI